MAAKVVIVGSNFAGLSAALEIKHQLGSDVDVTVLSKSPKFLFVPSLIWMPFGKRKARDVTFDVEPVCTSHQVNFHLAEALRASLDTRTVLTNKGEFTYDYLLVASGFQPDYSVVPGIVPGVNTYNITNVAEAEQAGEGWKKLVDDPGPVIIAATQGAGCFGAAYEFLFNIAHQLKKRRIHRKAPLTFVTAEPFAGHFGIGGLKHGREMLEVFFKMLSVKFVGNTAIAEAVPGELRLQSGESLPFRFAMVMPPFGGAGFVRQSPGLGDAKGLIHTRPTYQHERYDNVYAAGAAVAVQPPWQTPIATGVPKTGFPAEVMAATAAKNIAQQVRGEAPSHEKPFGDIPALCVMDAGNMGVMIISDRMLPPRKHEVLIPGPQAHWAKLAFEKYFLWKMKHGYVRLP